jgi:DNA-binding MarR family transcriptional regulator
MSKRTKDADVFSTIVVQILYLNGIIMEHGDQIASVAGQTSARWRVLAAVEEQNKTVAQIARDLRLTRQSVQRVVDSLAEVKLVAFVKNPADQRADLVVLEKTGRKALLVIQDEQVKWANAMANKIGAKSLNEINMSLGALLEKIQQN